jgi:raffinose/stachyose/melibiose transport system substrate-binding protein
MKKSVGFILAILLSIFCMSCLALGSSKKASGAPAVLKLITSAAQGAEGHNAIANLYHKKYPNCSVEITVMPSVEAFNTAMSAKLAAGDIPDIIQYQSGSLTNLYAAGGNLMDLTNTKFIKRAKPGTDTFCTYKDKIYALPVDLSVNGVLFNLDVAKKYGVSSKPPKNINEFLTICQRFAAKGLKEPIVMAAKNGSAITSFNFQYIYQNIYAKNPKFYVNVLKGEKHWNGSEFHGLYNTFAKFKPFINKDALGMDTAGAFQKFDTNNAAFLIGGSPDITNVRRGNPNMNLALIPPPWVANTKDLLAVSDVDTVIAISSKTKYPNEAKAFLDLFTTVGCANLYAKSARSISAIKGTAAQFDKCLSNQLSMLDAGKRIGFFSRQWIPGIKEIMKTSTQEWFGGQNIDTVLNHLEEEHQRLMKANPDYVKNFIQENQ